MRIQRGNAAVILDASKVGKNRLLLLFLTGSIAMNSASNEGTLTPFLGMTFGRAPMLRQVLGEVVQVGAGSEFLSGRRKVVPLENPATLFKDI